MDRFWISVFLVFMAFPTATSQVYCHDDSGKDNNGHCTKYSKDNKERRIMLIGKTGVGKSCTGNAILGFRAFRSGISAASVTRKTQYNETKRFGKKIVVVDTPGFLDTNLAETAISMEISKWYSLVSPGIHAIILVVPIGRFTDEEQKTVDFFMKVFGEDLKNYLIVVFTHKNLLEAENMTVDDYVKTLEASSNLLKLINGCKNRYTAIGYNGKLEDRVLEVQQILSMVEDIAGKDGENYYSNVVFQKVQLELEENEKKRKEQIIKNPSYTNEELLTLLDSIRKQTREDIMKDQMKYQFLLELAKIIGTVLTNMHFQHMLKDTETFQSLANNPITGNQIEYKNP